MAAQTRPDIEAIERRLERATPGPWHRGIGNESGVVYGPKDVIVVPTVGPDNGSLIANAPEDLRALSAYARELEALFKAVAEREGVKIDG